MASHTHFFCCETPSGTAADLQRYLLDHHGILIRDAANFRGLSPRHFRLATGTPDRNQLLINALKEWRPQQD
jgi:threonine-phosphate decarboxylase